MENIQNPNEKPEQNLIIQELEVTIEKLDSNDLASIAGGYSQATVIACCCCCCWG